MTEAETRGGLRLEALSQIQLAAPVCAGMLANRFVATSSTVIVGHLGSTQLAAVGLATSLARIEAAGAPPRRRSSTLQKRACHSGLRITRSAAARQLESTHLMLSSSRGGSHTRIAYIASPERSVIRRGGAVSAASEDIAPGATQIGRPSCISSRAPRVCHCGSMWGRWLCGFIVPI